MKTAGIIAEYNPFHNGHQYQIETVRHLTGADFVIVAMSGDFLQRGVPANRPICLQPYPKVYLFALAERIPNCHILFPFLFWYNVAT